VPKQRLVFEYAELKARIAEISLLLFPLPQVISELRIASPAFSRQAY
jgi:hypothetical protein